jgi:hypothetical protein
MNGRVRLLSLPVTNGNNGQNAPGATAPPNSGRGRMTAVTLASDAGCPRGVTCGTGVVSQAIGALLGLGT